MIGIIKKNFFITAIFLIFFSAFFLRVYKLSSYPVGFHIDEASLAYNGYSILNTGKDENNRFLPLYVDMFGDNRPSGYHYLTIPSIILFGLTEFATRFPGAVFGSISVFVFFFLAQSIFKDKKIAMTASLLLAFAPWHIVLSRASAESIVALFFILLGAAFVINSIRKKSIADLLIGSIFFAGSFFFYHTPRVFVPLLFLSIAFLTFSIWKKYLAKYKIFLASSFLAVSLISAILVFAVAGGTGRFSQVNIFNSFEAGFVLNQALSEDSKADAPLFLSRAIHNKITNIGYMFVSNYLSYFSGAFLFTEGGLPNWYSIPRMGTIYIVALPFVLYGIYILITKKDVYSKIPLVWLLIGPVVAAITLDDVPNINRASVMFPMLNLIAAAGIVSFARAVKPRWKKAALVFTVILFAGNFSYFAFQYIYNAKVHKPWYRNNGFSKMMDVVKQKYDSEDVILVSKFQGGIYPLVLFYLKFDPAEYQSAGSPKTRDYQGFGKIVFVPQDCPFTNYSPNFPNVKRIMYVESGSCPDDKRLKIFPHLIIPREDGTSAFRLVYD
jgi:4-amino-4-deoxy-L-arabinose transferase-like glycosyltransferase